MTGASDTGQVAAEGWRRRAKIVATLGPSTDGLEGDLVDAGLDVARLNFSHGTQVDHARRAAAIRRAATDRGRWVGLMQDLQGPKIRVGRLVGGGPVQLRAGQELAITTLDVLGTADRVSTTYVDLPRDVRPGDCVLLDDGRIRLTVLDASATEVRTTVEVGGPLGEHKGINLPGVAVSAPALTEKDREDLRFGLTEIGVDFVALSFVRTAEEVRQAREVVRSLGCQTPLIVKVEKPEALDHLDAIGRAADGVMVARGDLGVEMAPELVPAVQKRIVQCANKIGVPVITATQMLESMMTAESPTRAEATDVANAVWDGSDAVMLSGETAAGLHPLLAVQMMDRIVRAAESAELPRGGGESGRGGGGPRPGAAGRGGGSEPPGRSHAAAIAHAARVLAEDLEATAIVGITRTGRTAELLSRGRPAVPIFAYSPDDAVCRRLALWWGVTPVHLPLARSLAENVAAMERYLLDSGAAGVGDRLVIVGAHPFEAGVRTNFLKFQVLTQAE